MSNNYENLDKALIYLNEGILLEDTVCKDLQNNIYIGVFPDIKREFELDPYFKVSWKPINSSNKNVARISMSTGNYIIHNNSSVELPPKIIDKININLSNISNVTSKYKDSINIWEALLLAVSVYTNSSFETLKLKFPLIRINPNNNDLQGCSIIKWGK